MGWAGRRRRWRGGWGDIRQFFPTQRRPRHAAGRDGAAQPEATAARTRDVGNGGAGRTPRRGPAVAGVGDAGQDQGDGPAGGAEVRGGHRSKAGRADAVGGGGGAEPERAEPPAAAPGDRLEPDDPGPTSRTTSRRTRRWCRSSGSATGGSGRRCGTSSCASTSRAAWRPASSIAASSGRAGVAAGGGDEGRRVRHGVGGPDREALGPVEVLFGTQLGGGTDITGRWPTVSRSSAGRSRRSWC